MMGSGKRRHLSILGCVAAWFVNGSTASTPRPTALAVPASTYWYGLDGQWSAVTLQIGTSPQYADVFVSTSGQETLVVGTAGCDATDTVCISKRGGQNGGLFNLNASKTWKDEGEYALGLETPLGYEGDGVYGLDNVAFGGVHDMVSVASQTIGVIDFNSTDYFLGFFGLGIKPTNLTNVTQLSFLDSLVQNRSLIPSHSYGYTAGAYYRKLEYLHSPGGLSQLT